MRLRAAVLIVSLVALGPVLSACADFDMDKLDVFNLNEKKKLPGERRALFPEGVPGVQQGVPADLVKGYQPPPEEVKEAAVVAPAPEKPKPKPKRVVKRAAPTRVNVTPNAGQQQAPWPSDQAQPQQQQSQQQSSPWPDAPKPGTFSR
jgi:hypothetical protein